MVSEMAEPGTGGPEGARPSRSHILAQQLTLSQPWGADYAPNISARPHPLDFQT